MKYCRAAATAGRLFNCDNTAHKKREQLFPLSAPNTRVVFLAQRVNFCQADHLILGIPALIPPPRCLPEAFKYCVLYSLGWLHHFLRTRAEFRIVARHSQRAHAPRSRIMSNCDVWSERVPNWFPRHFSLAVSTQWATLPDGFYAAPKNPNVKGTYEK